MIIIIIIVIMKGKQTGQHSQAKLVMRRCTERYCTTAATGPLEEKRSLTFFQTKTHFGGN